MKIRIVLLLLFSALFRVFSDGDDSTPLRYLAFDSIIFYEGSERQASIYDKVTDLPDNVEETEVTTELLKIAFGPIEGYYTDKVKVGWNNQNRVLYVESKSPLLTTIDKLSIGATKDQVISALGKPHVVYDNFIRYQNTDFEVFGILFVLENDIVVQMISFAFV